VTLRTRHTCTMRARALLYIATVGRPRWNCSLTRPCVRLTRCVQRDSMPRIDASNRCLESMPRLELSTGCVDGSTRSWTSPKHGRTCGQTSVSVRPSGHPQSACPFSLLLRRLGSWPRGAGGLRTAVGDRLVPTLDPLQRLQMRAVVLRRAWEPRRRAEAVLRTGRPC